MQMSAQNARTGMASRACDGWKRTRTPSVRCAIRSHRCWLQFLSTGLMKRMSKRSMLWSSNTAAKSAGALAAT